LQPLSQPGWQHIRRWNSRFIQEPELSQRTRHSFQHSLHGCWQHPCSQHGAGQHGAGQHSTGTRRHLVTHTCCGTHTFTLRVTWHGTHSVTQ